MVSFPVLTEVTQLAKGGGGHTVPWFSAGTFGFLTLLDASGRGTTPLHFLGASSTEGAQGGGPACLIGRGARAPPFRRRLRDPTGVLCNVENI